MSALNVMSPKNPIDLELREMCSREGGKILCVRVDGEHQENKAF